MKMTILFSLIFNCVLISACSFGGVKPPIKADVWYSNDKGSNDLAAFKAYVKKRRNDRKECGMDVVVGESDNAKVNLCFENKGYHLEGGPVCESKFHWNDPICIDWRRKHSKPNAQPWS